MTDAETEPGELVPGGDGLDRVLLAHHRRFLGFLERRLGSRPDAEEVLQGAYLRAIERGLPEAEGDGLVAWFYRVLRNALTDRARRRDAEGRSTERLARELADAQEPEPELRAAICACVHDLLPGLKPEYADVVRAVDLDERALSEVAADRAITVNNATVRLHRARQALRKQLLRACGACAAHGCLECDCKNAPDPRSPG